jgi:hypothetical protein
MPVDKRPVDPGTGDYVGRTLFSTQFYRARLQREIPRERRPRNPPFENRERRAQTGTQGLKASSWQALARP